MKYLFVFLFYSSLAQTALCQGERSIRGKVLDDADGEAIANCSVFINNTVKGTTTNASGQFELANIAPGKFQLIVSSVGYESYAQVFSAEQLPLVLSIRLRRKSADLSAITVAPFVADGWDTYGQNFLEIVIGNTKNSSQCVIRNKEVIRFRFSKKKNQMTAVGDEPIVIENKALGYVINLQLEECSADFNNNTTVYLGYFLFSEMRAQSKKEQQEWFEHRQTAYYGSMMHFIRSLYNGQVQRVTEYNQEGFDLRRQVKVANGEKERVGPLYIAAQHSDAVSPDSLRYYKKIMRESDSVSQNQALTAVDLVSSEGDSTRSLFFTGKLAVTYRKRRKTDTEVERSTIYLLTPAPVQIESNGYYNSPLEIFVMGFWANSQKVSNMLPLDYEPED